MNCKDCKYNKIVDNEFYSSVWQKNIHYYYNVCDISHLCNKKSCDFIVTDSDVDKMDICYNCKHWIGGGDWNLSCDIHPYMATANGFRKACEMYDRKEWEHD